MESFKVGNSVVKFCIETTDNCETDIGKEIIRDTKVKCLCVVCEIELAEGDSIVAVIRDYCERFKDYPIVLLTSYNTSGDKNARVVKMRNQLAYNNLGFRELSGCYVDDDTQYYVATNKASMALLEILEVKEFMIQFSEIMADDKQTDLLIGMMTGERFNECMTKNIKRWVDLWCIDDGETIKRMTAFSDTK